MSIFSPNWVDLLILAVLGFGIWSGRRKGMSEELMDMLQWIAIAFLTPRLYGAPGMFLAAKLKVSLAPCLVFSYILFAILIVVGFGFIRKATGQKMLGKDFFGRMEYPLGMAGGVVRTACMVLVAMALLNARYTTPEEFEELERAQRDTLNGITLPTLTSIQHDVFTRSRAGLLVKYKFGRELIYSAPPTGESKPNDTDEVSQNRKK